jgi:hypothetical protein
MIRNELTAAQAGYCIQNLAKMALPGNCYTLLALFQAAKARAWENDSKAATPCLPTEKQDDFKFYYAHLYQPLIDIATEIAYFQQLPAASKITTPNSTEWSIHGRVLNSNRQPMMQSGSTVSSAVSVMRQTTNDQVMGSLTSTAAYFQFTFDQAGVHNFSPDNRFYLQVTGVSNGKNYTYNDPCMFAFRAGKLDYREIVLPAGY